MGARYINFGKHFACLKNFTCHLLPELAKKNKQLSLSLPISKNKTPWFKTINSLHGEYVDRVAHLTMLFSNKTIHRR
jgi:hypothetical protein